MIDLSVIILSYNTREVTDRCLTLAAAAAKKDTEIIVVDNGSTDGSAEMIAKKHPEVKLINTGQNLGFAAGNNLALRQATGKYLLLLNSDVFVRKETFVRTVNYFERHTQADVVGCRLELPSGRLQPSAGHLPTPKNVVLWLLGLDKLLGIDGVHPKNAEFFKKSRRVEWVMGAFLAMRRDVWEKTGGMDEHFFMYMEEVEWCWRMKTKGFSVWYVPEWTVTHLSQASSRGDVRGPLVKEMVGLSYLIQRHEPNAWWWLRPVLQAGNLARMVAWGLLLRPRKAAAYKEVLTKI